MRREARALFVARPRIAQGGDIERRRKIEMIDGRRTREGRAQPARDITLLSHLRQTRGDLAGEVGAIPPVVLAVEGTAEEVRMLRISRRQAQARAAADEASAPAVPRAGAECELDCAIEQVRHFGRTPSSRGHVARGYDQARSFEALPSQSVSGRGRLSSLRERAAGR